MEGKQSSYRAHAVALVVIAIGLIWSFLLITGCHNRLAGSDIINGEINVFGAALFAAQDYREIKGVVPAKEPCIKGYEYFYDPLDISIGYGTNGSIRKITTRNRETSMFNIRVGDSFAAGKEKIAKAGFQQGNTPYKFVKDWCLFTFLVNEKQDIFGMTVEVLD